MGVRVGNKSISDSVSHEVCRVECHQKGLKISIPHTPDKSRRCRVVSQMKQTMFHYETLRGGPSTPHCLGQGPLELLVPPFPVYITAPLPLSSLPVSHPFSPLYTIPCGGDHMSAPRDNGSAASDRHDNIVQCPHCGEIVPSDSSRVSELEHENRVLQTQAIAAGMSMCSSLGYINAGQAYMIAADRLAEYEAQIGRLQASRQRIQHSNKSSQESNGSDRSDIPPDSGTEPPRPTLSRFGSLLQSRRSPSNALQTSQSQGDLQNALAREVALRQEAEKKVKEVNGELEDLSQNLFEQANEMVASERRAKAKLEERVAILEQRDKEKSRRLEKIEGNLRRLERVRTLLSP